MKVKSESEVAQSCPTLSDPMDCSPPGSSVHGIFQARVLEWGAIAFSAMQHDPPTKKKNHTGKWNAVAEGLRGAWSPGNLGVLLASALCVGMFTPKLNPLPVSLGVFLSIAFYPCDNLSMILSSRSLKLFQ